MFSASESPGNIKNQVGRSLNAIREQIEQEDVMGLANQTRLLLAIASPKLPKEARGKLKMPTMPDGRDRDGTGMQKVFEACLQLVEDILCLLAEQNIYAWTDSEAGDAGELALRSSADEDREGAEA